MDKEKVKQLEAEIKVIKLEKEIERLKKEIAQLKIKDAVSVPFQNPVNPLHPPYNITCSN